MLLKKLITYFRNLICLVGLFFVSPLIFLAAMAIIIEDGMPIFFIQNRIGKNKSNFRIIKIRTLKNEAPDVGTHQLDQKYDLNSGKLLRRIKLDELPQLINVLKGDINLIGPRPGLISQIELTESRNSKGVYEVKPGITGLSQVLGYDMTNPIKLAEIDKFYIDNKSLYMDSLILIGTFIKYPKQYLEKIIEQ